MMHVSCIMDYLNAYTHGSFKDSQVVAIRKLLVKVKK